VDLGIKEASAAGVLEGIKSRSCTPQYGLGRGMILALLNAFKALLLCVFSPLFEHVLNC
jgi:hypothetical protein